MDYPDWAPSVLVKLHKTSLEKPIPKAHPTIKFKKLKNIPDSVYEEIRSENYRRGIIELPRNEGAELLGKLLTDLNMKKVWVSLSKRNKETKQYHRYWNACQNGILGWRYNRKLTSKQHREYFNGISEDAINLYIKLRDTKEFINFSIADLIAKERIKWCLEAIKANPLNEPSKNKSNKVNSSSEPSEFSDEQIEFSKLAIGRIIPSLQYVLFTIAEEARQYANEKPIVLKPGSDNAEIHYFIRYLSRYMQKEYGQPLHDIVATTTSVLFEKDIDSDYVRKVIK